MSPETQPLTWRTLEPISLPTTRFELHGAALVMASVADSILEAQPDDSQSNLGLKRDPCGFATRVFELGTTTAQLTLDGPLQRLIWWNEGEPREVFALPGRTMREALDWAQTQARGAEGRVLALTERRFPGMPPIDVLAGGVFRRGDPDALRVFFDWYANAEALFESLRGGAPALTSSRVWPHHFDLGALLPLRESDGPAEVQVGLGLSPGDELCPDPYSYCSPYPQPPLDCGTPLPKLPVGAWHRGHSPPRGFAPRSFSRQTTSGALRSAIYTGRLRVAGRS